jgi:hypothetical protein
MRKKNKMSNICRRLRKKTKIYPVLKSFALIGFIGVKKWVEIAHLGTFKVHGKHQCLGSGSGSGSALIFPFLDPGSVLGMRMWIRCQEQGRKLTKINLTNKPDFQLL